VSASRMKEEHAGFLHYQELSLSHFKLPARVSASIDCITVNIIERKLATIWLLVLVMFRLHDLSAFASHATPLREYFYLLSLCSL